MIGDAIGVVVLSYLIGSVPTGLVLVRLLRGEDIRKYGSGNIGTVNVFRVAGTPTAVAVLAVDVLKGLAPVLLAVRLGAGPWVVMACGLAAIVGHNWSVFLGFRGGKGIATSFGVLAGLSLVAALVAAAVWIVVVAITRYSSLGSLLGVLSVPLVLWRIGAPQAYVAFGVIAAAFAIYRHRSNIRRLVAGTELRINDEPPSRSMHVLCYGAGAVGSLIGGLLSRSGTAQVTLLARRAHVAAVRTWGLHLETPGGVVSCKRLDSITSLDDLRHPPDVAILTVKAYHTADAVAHLAPFLPPGARVVTLQNGVGNEEAIAAEVGADRTLSGAMTLNVSLLRPGVVRQVTAVGGIALSPVGRGARTTDLADALTEAGLQVEVFPEYRAMKWSKLLLNILGNATCAILDLPPSEIVQNPRLFALEREAFHEAVRVMERLDLRPVALPGFPVPSLVKAMRAPGWVARRIVGPRLAGGRGAKMPSMWEDLDRGRDRSEVEVLNGAVAREGAKAGVPTPVNALLTEVLMALVAGRRDRAEFRRKPDALLALSRAR
jgi:2-dehydropantoate 2-reductase